MEALRLTNLLKKISIKELMKNCLSVVKILNSTLEDGYRGKVLFPKMHRKIEL